MQTVFRVLPVLRYQSDLFSAFLCTHFSLSRYLSCSLIERSNLFAQFFQTHFFVEFSIAYAIICYLRSYNIRCYIRYLISPQYRCSRKQSLTFECWNKRNVTVQAPSTGIGLRATFAGRYNWKRAASHLSVYTNWCAIDIILSRLSLHFPLEAWLSICPLRYYAYFTYLLKASFFWISSSGILSFKRKKYHLHEKRKKKRKKEPHLTSNCKPEVSNTFRFSFDITSLNRLNI